MSLSEEEIDQLSDRFITKLEASRTISDETHRHHHRWIDHKISKEKKREQMWDKVKANVVGAVIITILGIIGSALTFFGKPVIKFISELLAKKLGG